MSVQEICEKIRQHQHLVLTLIAILLALIFLFFRAQQVPREEDDLIIEEWLVDNSEDQEELYPEIDPEVSDFIFVDIKGQIHQPSVYQLPLGARMIDLIDLAGGFTAEADQNQINLALLLSDQQLVYVPSIGEEIPSAQTSSSAPDSTNNAVNINTADASELMTLNGIGQKKAEQIIHHREQNGSFKRIEDLKDVSGIGDKTFENLKDSIKVGP